MWEANEWCYHTEGAEAKETHIVRRQTTKPPWKLESYEMVKARWCWNHEHEITGVPILSQKEKGTEHLLTPPPSNSMGISSHRQQDRNSATARATSNSQVFWLHYVSPFCLFQNPRKYSHYVSLSAINWFTEIDAYPNNLLQVQGSE